jgi:hypothetical protein
MMSSRLAKNRLSKQSDLENNISRMDKPEKLTEINNPLHILKIRLQREKSQKKNTRKCEDYSSHNIV